MLAEARRLFTEGVGHTQAERWTEAATSFRAALELHAAPPIRYNLAAALVELGQHREALEQVELVLADPSAPANIAELTRGLRERIRSASAMLTISVAGEAEGAAVHLDGEALDAAWLAREIPVAPGAHTVSAVREGETVAEAEVTTRAGEPARVRLFVRAGGVGPGPGPGPSEPGGEPPLHETWWFWAAVGGGALVLVTIISIIAVAAQPGSPADPVQGNFTPGVITW